MEIRAENIKKIREWLGLNQTAFANAIDTYQPQVNKWENGHVKAINAKFLPKIKRLIDKKKDEQRENSTMEVNENSSFYGIVDMDNIEIEFMQLHQHLSRLELGYKQMKQRLAQYEAA